MKRVSFFVPFHRCNAFSVKLKAFFFSSYSKHPSFTIAPPVLQPADLQLPANFRIVGIESSCDDTSICLMSSNREILFERTCNQATIHSCYGGVVPMLASEAHRYRLPFLLKEMMTFWRDNYSSFCTLTHSSQEPPAFHIIAATRGPGLLASVAAGWQAAKEVSAVLNVPLIGVHHMEGHALMSLFESKVALKFPFYSLLVSGGHTLILKMSALGSYELLAASMDDNIGECLDKAARALGLGWMPGHHGGLAAQLEIVAENGNPDAFTFSVPFSRDKALKFSFCGLKSAFLRRVTTLKDSVSQDEKATLDGSLVSDLAASFQKAVFDHVENQLERLQKQEDFQVGWPLVISGGVARNKLLRTRYVYLTPIYLIFTQRFC